MNLSWRKGARGQKIVWIGVSLQPICSDRKLLIALPPKFRDEVTTEISSILATTMVGLRRLRSLTGRLSWAAGVLPRARWAVNILYAVVTSAFKD
eukprot:4095070-Amphidinium_carterae.1